MTTPTRHLTTSSRSSSASWALPFLRHYLEMVVVMIIGMVALGSVESWASGLLADPTLLARPDVKAVVMATNMTLPMAAWMRFRGHSWPPVLEMSAAMIVPFAVLLVPLWLGAISASALMTGGHVLMFIAMAVAMLLRRDEYVAHRCD